MARDFGRRCGSGNTKRKAEEERRDQIMLSNTYKLTAYFAVQTREGDAAAVAVETRNVQMLPAPTSEVEGTHDGATARFHSECEKQVNRKSTAAVLVNSQTI